MHNQGGVLELIVHSGYFWTDMFVFVFIPYPFYSQSCTVSAFFQFLTVDSRYCVFRTMYNIVSDCGLQLCDSSCLTQPRVIERSTIRCSMDQAALAGYLALKDGLRLITQLPPA